MDSFAVADLAKARSLPNILFVFLEGVTPTSISAYGKRTVRGTPNIDSVARDGTMFMQARCFYPSTWDGWFSTLTGRFLRVQEMDMSRPFGDRYSRYSNLYKVLRLTGINRWCHMNCPPYYKSLVPEDMYPTAWMPDFDSEISGAKTNLWKIGRLELPCRNAVARYAKRVHDVRTEQIGAAKGECLGEPVDSGSGIAGGAQQIVIQIIRSRIKKMLAKIPAEDRMLVALLIVDSGYEHVTILIGRVAIDDLAARVVRRRQLLGIRNSRRAELSWIDTVIDERRP